MKPSIQKLQKYFRLEASSGYPNRAVIGGLERMLDAWVPEARADGVPEDLIQLVVARIQDYGRLPQKGRAELLQGLWKRIQRGEADPTLDDFIPSIQDQQAVEPAEGAGDFEPSSAAVVVELAPELAASTDGEAAEPIFSRPLEVDRQPAVAIPVTPPIPTPPPLVIPEPSNLPPPAEPKALRAPLTVVEGIGPKHAAVLERLGLHTLLDMLYYFPRRYDDYSRMVPINRLKYGEEVTVIGTVMSVRARPVQNGRMTIVEAVVSDGAGSLRVTWFNQIQIAKKLRQGVHISLAGKVKQYLGRPVMDNPAWEFVEEDNLITKRIVPIYPLTSNLTNKWLIGKTSLIVSHWALRVPDPLPPEVRRQAGLVGLQTALLQIHFPDGWDELKAAQERLAFDEIFLLQLGVLNQKRQWQERTARAFSVPAEWLDEREAALPYRLTGAQKRVLADLRADLQSGRPMNRLIQGDVGSGKTVVAALLIGMTAREGAQAALMAPTAILAEQHYKSMLKLLAGASNEPESSQLPLVKPSAPAFDVNTWRRHAVPVEETPDDDASADVEETDEAEDWADATSAELLQTVDEITFITEGIQTEEIITVSPTEDILTEEIPAEETPAEETPAEETPAEETPAEETPPPPPLLQESEIRLIVGATPDAEKRAIREALADGSVKLVIGTHALIEDPVVFQNLELVIVDEQHRFGVEQRAALRSKGVNPHLLVMTATPIPRSLALTIYGDLDLSVIDELPPGRQPVGTYVLMPRERERAYTLIRGQVEQRRQAFIIYPLIESGADEEVKAAVDEHARLQREVFPRLSLGLLHGRMPPDEKDAVMADFRAGRYHVLVSTTVIEVGVDVPNATVMLIESANRFGLAQLHQLRGRVGRNAEKSYCLLIPDSPDQAENARLEVMASTTDGFVLAEKDLEQRGPGQFLGTRQAGYAEMRFANLTDVRLIEKARRFAQMLFEQDPDLARPENRLLALALQQSWSRGAGDIS